MKLLYVKFVNMFSVVCVVLFMLLLVLVELFIFDVLGQWVLRYENIINLLFFIIDDWFNQYNQCLFFKLQVKIVMKWLQFELFGELVDFWVYLDNDDLIFGCLQVNMLELVQFNFLWFGNSQNDGGLNMQKLSVGWFIFDFGSCWVIFSGYF